MTTLRKEFVRKALEPGVNISELCREFKIARKTGYKWIQRFKEEGYAGLQDQSKRPHKYRIETEVDMALEVIRVRQKHPRWGPITIRGHLVRNGLDCQDLSERTIARILKRAGMVEPSRKPRNQVSSTRPEVIAKAPNDLWTTDFKGWWCTTDKQRCEPLTIRDAASRYILGLTALPSTAFLPVRKVFEYVFATYGLPKAIQSDNGQPFACSTSLCGLTQLSAWWVSLGIQLVRSRPGCPQDNGGHERMHADIAADLEINPSTDLDAQQEAFDVWREEFNHVRPHQSLELHCPGDIYVRSDRSLPSAGIGGFEQEGELRKVVRNGYTNFRGNTIFVSRALQGHHVLFVESDESTRVWFHNLELGYLDEDRRNVLPIFKPDLDEEETGVTTDEEKDVP